MSRLSKRKYYVNLLGGFLALLGYFLPFSPGRPLFHILEHTPFPYFSLFILLLTVLAMVLYSLGFSPAARLVSGYLLLGWLFFLVLLLWVYSPAVLAENLSPSACLLPLGLMAMTLWPE